MIWKNLSYSRIAFAVWIPLLENVQKGKGKIKWYISYTCVFFNASVGVKYHALNYNGCMVQNNNYISEVPTL